MFLGYFFRSKVYKAYNLSAKIVWETYNKVTDDLGLSPKRENENNGVMICN